VDQAQWTYTPDCMFSLIGNCRHSGVSVMKWFFPSNISNEIPNIPQSCFVSRMVARCSQIKCLSVAFVDTCSFCTYVVVIIYVAVEYGFKEAGWWIAKSLQFPNMVLVFSFLMIHSHKLSTRSLILWFLISSNSYSSLVAKFGVYHFENWEPSKLLRSIKFFFQGAYCAFYVSVSWTHFLYQNG